MIKISNRLKTIAEMVTPCGVVADIGCDHCLTLMYLLENQICDSCIGSDVKAGPIGKAREGLLKYGYGEKVELREGDGLSTLSEGEADAIIISGMGGGLINEIVAAGVSVAKAASQLIVQPQNDACDVRKTLHRLGFMIKDEKMVLEQGKYYCIIKSAPGEEKYENEAYYLYGGQLIHNKDKLLARFLRERLAKNSKISTGLLGRETENCELRLSEIENENSIIREVLLCL